MIVDLLEEEEDRFVVVVERWDSPVVVGHSMSRLLHSIVTLWSVVRVPNLDYPLTLL